MQKVLVIDDDRAILHMIRHGLQQLGVEVITATSADEGLSLVTDKIGVVLLDLMLPRMSGLEVFQRIHAIDRRLPVIFITAGAGSETAIEAMQMGAYDYLAKPIDLVQLRELITKALETRRLMLVPVAVSVNKDESDANSGDLFIGRSPSMLEVFKSIGQVSRQNITVLIRGESGTGKELVARALYQFSDRASRPFMAVNCAALSDTLLESELFGHEKGSFTGADRRRIGKFEQCTGGTLFLDEVGDMSPLVQGKVLRLIQEQRFERVGGNDTIETDVRLIAATNRPLEQMVQKGIFRSDLFYRLNVMTISLPPLRQRKGDIPLLLEHYLTQVRKDGTLPYLRPDGKTQVTIEYDGDKAIRLDTVVVSSQHASDIDLESMLVPGIREEVVAYVLGQLADEGIKLETDDYRLLVNPTGRFEIGGPMGDAGLTGRKIIIDTYGGMARHGGGAFSGKDPSKVDRSAAYAGRWVAKNLVWGW